MVQPGGRVTLKVLPLLQSQVSSPNRRGHSCMFTHVGCLRTLVNIYEPRGKFHTWGMSRPVRSTLLCQRLIGELRTSGTSLSVVWPSPAFTTKTWLWEAVPINIEIGVPEVAIVLALVRLEKFFFLKNPVC